VHCLFTSDLHGDVARYAALLRVVRAERPDGVFLGGDLLRHGQASEEFMAEHLLDPIRALRADAGGAGAGPPRPGPRWFVILGNDDPRVFEEVLRAADAEGLIEYVHERTVPFGGLFVTGYACVPPTPFLLKDWEKYDVSRYVDPGCVSPEEGRRSVPVAENEVRNATIAADLEALGRNAPPARTIFLFHSPPYDCALDRAALDGRMVDHVPVDVHVGSIAIQRFIAERRPLLTLHGHVHEAPRLTGRWSERFGRTHAFCGCHDGPGLPLVRFDTEALEGASREIVAG
jgi:Icc-related predicted phosphoesterase